MPTSDGSGTSDMCKGRTDDQHVGQPFTDPAACNKFYTCGSDGKAYSGTCPPGSYYDTTLCNCSQAAKAACGDRKV
ncbi:hypothetical protein H4R21_000237 [Coemansia helicoidea]|uniref:Uncharacterized protein n=1 Tax=Coemansia helicoidea TaxID=1286919 RepID=A0ACC1LGK9_9FUNG|nr:hypothetical protein H4R21_000237 [Coemansia helicoidea]